MRVGGGGVGLTKTVAVIFDFCSSKLFSFSSFSSLSSFFLSDLDLVGRPAFSAFMASRVFPVLRVEGTPASERGDDGERDRERERERLEGQAPSSFVGLVLSRRPRPPTL